MSMSRRLLMSHLVSLSADENLGCPRRLDSLVSVGPAMLRDSHFLGIHTVAQLARQNPRRLYERLCQITGQSQDVCCLDVFCAAIAQAHNPRLPAVQRHWWYWSR